MDTNMSAEQTAYDAYAAYLKKRKPIETPIGGT